MKLPTVDAGRVHDADLARVLAQRQRESFYIALGPVALIIDIPQRWKRCISVDEIRERTS